MKRKYIYNFFFFSSSSLLIGKHGIPGIAWKDNSDHNDNIINKDNNSNAINNSNNNDKNDNNVGVLMENRLASTAANNNAPNETRKFWFKNSIAKHESFVIIEMFTMVFIAEWADKSQLAVIILTAQQVSWLNI